MEELMQSKLLVDWLQFGALVLILSILAKILQLIYVQLKLLNTALHPEKFKAALNDLGSAGSLHYTVNDRLKWLNEQQEERGKALNQAAEERLQRLIQVIYSRK